jgi:peroxiredoxin
VLAQLHRVIAKMKLTEGITFPDYELPDHTGVQRRLSVLQGRDPMVLVLGRGRYCPKDHRQLLDLRDFSQRCVVGYAQLVTINTDPPMEVGRLRQDVGADWIFLSDEERRIEQDFGIEDYTDTKRRPMIPHTLVLEPRLKICKVYNGYWFWGRPTPHELHLDLRVINERIRPDWRLDDPEVRAAWERGETNRFFPYGEDPHQVLVRMSRALDQFAAPPGGD